MRVKFGDVVTNVNDSVKDPTASGIERLLGLEHLDAGELAIARWGMVSEETTFTRRVRPGQTLFGKRRAYQRKTAYAEFDAICSGDILVFATKDPGVLIPELLPFLASTDSFYAKALETSAGSLSPRTRWSDLAKYEFDLPPLDEQQRIADLLWASERHSRALAERLSAASACATAATSFVLDGVATATRAVPLKEVVSSARPLCYGVVQPGTEASDGVPLVRVCDMEAQQIDLGNLRRISPAIDVQYKRSRLKAGDLLVSVVGTIGRVHVATEGMAGFNIARAVARVAPERDLILPEYLALVLRSPVHQALLQREAFESARKTLNLAALGALMIPVPSVERQVELLEGLRSSDEATRLAAEESRACLNMRQHLINSSLRRAS
jgi:type I restriction enzyme S subunit